MRGTRPEAILIDAHNLLYADAALRALMHRDQEAARRELLERLGDAAATWVFFDGGPGGVTSATMHGRIHVDWSGPHSADDRIIAWLTRHPGTRALVVTDDRPLAARCRHAGARVQSCVAFLAGLDVREDERTPADGKPPLPDADEVAYWLRQFGGDEGGS